MTENDSEFFGDLDEPDVEMPQDGRDGQPPEEGSQDDPETLDVNDPLRNEQTVLSETDSPTTVAGQAAEPLAEDDWALEEQQVLDEDEFEEEFPEDTE